MTGVRARESLDARSEVYLASTMPNLLLIEFRFWLSLEALFSCLYPEAFTQCPSMKLQLVIYFSFALFLFLDTVSRIYFDRRNSVSTVICLLIV